MSYTPNTKEQYRDPLLAGKKENGEPVENAYYHGYLNDKDASEIFGYDYASDTFDVLFHNLDIYDDVFEELGIDINKDAPDLKAIYEKRMLSEYSEDELCQMSQTTKICKAFHDIVLHWLNMERDEIVTGMIDSMDEDEYDEIKNKVDNEGYENCVVKYWGNKDD